MLINNILFVSGSDPTGSIQFISPKSSGGNNTISISSTEDSSLDYRLHRSASDTVDLLFITTSGDSTRIGIGTKDPKTQFDLKTQEDNAEGTRFLLRSGRGTNALQPGDVAGEIDFVAESGSFKNIETSGSLGKIKAVITNVSKEGATGKIALSVAKDIRAAGLDIVDWQYGDNVTAFAQTMTASLITKDFSSGTSDSRIEMKGLNDEIYLSARTGSLHISGNLSIEGIANVSQSIADASNSGGGGGSADNLGNHTATQDLNLANFDINNITTASIDYLEVNDKLQGNGSGFQFFSFNEDTSRVKFVNWYGSQDNQYGMGMLWYETWFAAIDTDGNANDTHRRIGFYLEQPEAGATDSVSGETGRHPNNARFYVDVTGSYVASGGLHVTDANFDVESNGNVNVNGTLDMNTNDINNVDNMTITGAITASAFSGSELRISENGTGLRMTNRGAFDADGTDFRIFATNTNLKLATNGSSGTRLTLNSNSASFETPITSQGYNVISQSGDFVNNEFIVAVGANAITSSDALAVDSDGNLGIGTSTPDVRLHMLGEAPQTTQILMEQYNDTADAPDIRTRRFRGTPSAPADVQTGDYLFRLNVEGRDGGANTGYGSMQFDVDSNDQDALNFKLTTRDTSGNSGIRYKINGSGDHEFTGSLDVSGSFSATIDGGTF